MTAPQDLFSQIEEVKRTVARLEKRLAKVETCPPGKICTNHRYIVRLEGVCGGRPIIEGTRISVKTIVSGIKLGWTLQDILDYYPFLAAAEVADALAYYQDNPEQIEAEFTEEQRFLEQEIPRLQQLITSQQIEN